MFDKIQQINKARKMAKEMEEKMAKTPCNTEHGCVALEANLAEVVKVQVSLEFNQDNAEKIKNDMIKAMNKYLKTAEDGKRKIMTESMGGMSEMMKMFGGQK